MLLLCSQCLHFKETKTGHHHPWIKDVTYITQVMRSSNQWSLCKEKTAGLHHKIDVNICASALS